MNLEKFVAVTGNVNGVFKVMATRGNGLIITDLDTGKHKFASQRLNDFTPIESVGIYTDDDGTKPLPEIFQEMLNQLETNPPISHNAKPDELFAYFETVVPNYDRDKVLPRDIKKVIKWFMFLNDRNLLTADDTENPEEGETATLESEEDEATNTTSVEEITE
ncbi:MAG: hypothetical protein HC892_09080 [Saprospiraceae bacterium]|nr:hypothetical protein [Saprospiraceae bacterium]